MFLASMRGNIQDQIRVGRDFKVEGNLLYFQHTNCYNKIQRQWHSQYKGEMAPGKSTIKDALKKSATSFKDIKSTRMGDRGKNTSAICISGVGISVWEEILDAVHWQESEMGVWKDSPATPIENQSPRKDSENIQNKMPF